VVDVNEGLLRAKVVVVSGVGPGLGAAIAEQSARAGADVVLAARTESRLEKTAARVREAGRRALVVPTDITDEASCERLRARATEEFAHIDALVNNAFAMPPMKTLTDTDLQDIRSTFETSVLAALRLTRLFAPDLERSGGSVVMINSAVIRHSRPEYGAYKMAKASLLAMAQNLSAELGPRGIRVNSVAPGYIYAGALKWYFDHLASERGVTHQDVYDEIAASTDLRRLPLPDEVADAVVFLCSDMARAITGQCLDVNAGEFHH
jgi:NAD(P)-dependent dehydrogenase (short-subunit alcohol dehydrogenase family)